MNLSEMSNTPAKKPAAHRLWHHLCEYLQRRIRLRRSGLRWTLALEPAGAVRPARAAARPRASPRPRLPPMPGAHATAARHELRVLLDHAPSARRVWPSLALLERVLGSGSADNIHRVEAAVLRHAARSLDQLGDELFGPGLVVLRRRVELILRRKHGDRPSHWTRLPPPAGVERPGRFGDSLTDYIEMDQLKPFMARPAGLFMKGRHAAPGSRDGERP